jgi:hypothetical protein
MNNEFGQMLKELREKKFPGQSLRRVGERLTSLGDFGDYFFTQLNKMEAGSLIPSPNLVLRLMEAYGANEREKKDIFIAYSLSVAHKKMQGIDQISNKSTMNEAVHQLYRKVKKKK